MHKSKFISKKHLRQALACLPVLFTQFLMGIGWGWAVPTLFKLQDKGSPVQMTAEQISWIVSINEIGRIGSPFVSPFIIDNIGRRCSLVLVSITTLLIWIGHSFMRDFYSLCTFRLLFGAIEGLQEVVSPIYTTENCSPEIGDTIALLMTLVFNLGSSFELIVALNLSYQMTALVNTFLAICTLCTLYFCVETPQYLIMKGKHSQAEKNFAWLHDVLDPNDLANEMEKLKIYVCKENEKRTSIKTLLLHPENVKGIGLLFCIYLCSTATGGSATGTYVTEIYLEAKNVSLFLYLMHVMRYAFMVISPFLREKIKEMRGFLIFGNIMVGILRSCMAILFHVYYSNNYAIKCFPWMIFIANTSYGLISTLTGSAQYILRGELLPLSVRALGGSVAIITQAATGFVVLKTFHPIKEYFGIEMNFWLYAMMAFVLAIILYFYLPKRQGELTSRDSNNKEDRYQQKADV